MASQNSSRSSLPQTPQETQDRIDEKMGERSAIERDLLELDLHLAMFSTRVPPAMMPHPKRS